MAINKAGTSTAQRTAELKLSTGLKAETRLLNVASKMLAAASRPGTMLPKFATTMAARFAGAKLTPMSRRVTIKTLLAKHYLNDPFYGGLVRH